MLSARTGTWWGNTGYPRLSLRYEFAWAEAANGETLLVALSRSTVWQFDVTQRS